METKTPPGISWLGLLVILVSLVSCPVMGQFTSKQLITKADYGLWNRAKAGSMSADGNWVSWSVHYDSGLDTLFVAGTDGKKRFHFAKGQQGVFFGKDGFGCMFPDGKGMFSNLKKGTREPYDKAESITALGNFAVFLRTDGKLSIIDEYGKVIFSQKHCRRYVLSPKGTSLLYLIGENENASLGLVRINDVNKVSDRTVAERGTFDLASVGWSDDETAIAAGITDGKGTTILYYSVTNNSLRYLDEEGIPAEKHIDKDAPILLPGNGKRVFVTLRGEPLPPKKTVVEVWNAADKVIYPKQEEIQGWRLAPLLAMWQPMENRFRQLADDKFPKATVTTDGKHVLLWNPNDYEPQYEFVGKHDIYIDNLETGVRQLLLTEQSDYVNEWCTSPTGNNVTYFRNGEWWNYNIPKERHDNLSIILKMATAQKTMIHAGPSAGPVWDKDDRAVLLSDAYDIWKLDPDKGTAKRLTYGREKKKIYRIPEQANASAVKGLQEGFRSRMTNLDQALIFSCVDEKYTTSAYFRFDKNGLKQIVQGEPRLFDVNVSGETITWFSETYERPPELYSSCKGKIKRLAKTMPNHKRFLWSTAERIEYVSGKDSLAGILFYPACYDKTKTYPMIVHVYEKLSQRLRHYVNPSAYSGGSINVSNFTSQGYFVLFPDIVYETGKPGQSALRCVEAAMDAVLAIAPVDSRRVGLAGYSYGGYEANFIAAHSNRFATIVSGAGFSDFVSAYHSVATNYGIPEYFRFETFQMRMKEPFARDKQGYIDNSPLFDADKVNTPLLLFTGGKDKQIRPEQSMEYHLALRRLGKENVLLWYPEEGHSFNNRESQADLTRKLEAWFSHYLKGEPREDWMIAE